MRGVASAAVLLTSLLGTTLANPSPNFEVAKTSISIDRHREALDNGEIIVRVQRTDDLFSDPTASEAAQLLAEKQTHIGLRIQLDPVAGTVNVNDQPIDLLSPDGEGSVFAVQAETYALPADHDSPVLDPEQLNEILSQLSPGIVGIDVRALSEPASPSLAIAAFREGEDVPESIQTMTIRRVGLFIRITEVEGKALPPHETVVFTPIMQLVVVGNAGKVEKLATVSIDGRPPVDEAFGHLPGPVIAGSLPEEGPSGRRPPPPHQHGEEEEHDRHHDEHHHKHHDDADDDEDDEEEKENHERPQHPHPHHHHHHHHGKQGERPSATGFLGWLSRLFGVAPDAGRHPCPGMRMGKGRFGGKRPHPEHHLKDGQNGVDLDEKEDGGHRLPTHRFLEENPFSGSFDDDEDFEHKRPKHPFRPRPENSDVNQTQGDETQPPAHRRPHHHHGPHRHHKHHGRVSRFFHRMAIGFIYGLALIGSIFFHPVSLMFFAGSAIAVLATQTVLRYRFNRRLAREGAVRLPTDAEDEVSKPLVMSEKAAEKEREALQEVVVDSARSSQDLPRYEEH